MKKILFLTVMLSAVFCSHANSAENLALEESLKAMNFDSARISEVMNELETSLTNFGNVTLQNSTQNMQFAIESLQDTQQVVPGNYPSFEIRNEQDEAIRELLLSKFANATTRQRSCNTAAEDWLALYSHYYDRAPQKSVAQIVQLVSDAGRVDEFTQKQSAFQQLCLEPADSIPAELLNLGIGDVLSFIISDDQPICGALRIRNDVFVTARHCFYNPISGRAYNTNSTIGLSILSTPNELIQIIALSTSITDKNFEINPVPFGITNDYLFVHTEQPIVDFPDLEFEQPAPSDELILIGFYRFYDTPSLFRQPLGITDSQNWADGIYWDNSQQCITGETTIKCSAHYCQSDAQYSGTPIFRKSAINGKLTIAGIHISSMGPDLDCSFNWAKRQGNVSIQFPSQ